MWIHEHSNWPQFSWDANVLGQKLAEVRHRQGRLLGRMEALGFDLQREARLIALTDDVVKSSAIEGENLARDEVRSSIARRLGMDNTAAVMVSRHVEGVVEMMIDATQQFSKPLTMERLFGWHAALFPTGRSGLRMINVANWRTLDGGPMQVVSGPIGKETVHFEAPRADRIEKEMRQFLDWFESRESLVPLIGAGIAHFWFVTIHPFEDGNGRIARVIGDMALARADGTHDRFFSLSAQIEIERKAYYSALEQQQRATLDITKWLSWFLDCADRAIVNAETTLGSVLFKAKLWGSVNKQTVNERQQLVLNRMLEEDFKGFMNSSKYAKLTKCSTDTALRDIRELKELGLFIQNQAGGRSTSYRLAERESQEH
jgi:Fic family protein